GARRRTRSTTPSASSCTRSAATAWKRGSRSPRSTRGTTRARGWLRPRCLRRTSSRSRRSLHGRCCWRWSRSYGGRVPELPEVETVRRGLAPALEGRTLERVDIADARLTRPFDPVEVARELEGERVQAVDRRGKYLIVRFASGRALLVHLRMTGSFLHDAAGALPEDAHRRAVVKLDDGSDVAYRDVRRFGTWLVL